MRNSKTKLAATAVLVMAVALVTVAEAKVNKLNGDFPSDDNAEISMGLKISKKGKPKKLVDIKYENVDINCHDGSTGVVSGTAPNAKVTEPRPGRLVFQSSDNNPEVEPAVGNGPAGVTIEGVVQSKKAVGGIFAAFVGSSCGTNYQSGLGSSSIGFTAEK